MPITAYSQRFQRELDAVQWLDLSKYDLQSDPNLKNLPQELRDESSVDLTCPQCGAKDCVIVSASKSKKTKKDLRQPHFRFSNHHPLCDYHIDSNHTSKIDFAKKGNSRIIETEKIRELVANGIELKIISQSLIKEMRRYFFETKVKYHFTLDVSQTAFGWYLQLTDLCHLSNKEIIFNPIHANFPKFDWNNAIKVQFVQENYNLINMCCSKESNYHTKIYDRALKSIKQYQNKPVFDVTKLEEQYKKTINLALFIERNLKIFKPKRYSFTHYLYKLKYISEIRIVLAFAALLLYVSDWNIETAIIKLEQIVNFCGPYNINPGNVIGLNPFHDFEAWAIVMKAREAAQNSPNGFDYNAQIKEIENRLREEYEKWKDSKN
ncbi:hypothetical protein NIES267_73960 (plasmid) [Calothrix parasitica NIES-267]|uniref:Uncharacterized protein n=1 Tax=Calothrix parasitica NIES-267 TaxID=1973488 RepID=A0A1Z4M319_9CYAN|nr:hypothetical protein NIES267_73960 [Calothrix parasitica NIES-267]